MGEERENRIQVWREKQFYLWSSVDFPGIFPSGIEKTVSTSLGYDSGAIAASLSPCRESQPSGGEDEAT